MVASAEVVVSPRAAPVDQMESQTILIPDGVPDSADSPPSFEDDPIETEYEEKTNNNAQEASIRTPFYAKRSFKAGCTGLVVLTCILAISLSVRVSKDNVARGSQPVNVTQSPTPQPTPGEPSAGPSSEPSASLQPSALPTTTLFSILEPITELEHIQDSLSSEYKQKAYEWLQQDAHVSESSASAIQRFALSCFYFSTFAVESLYTGNGDVAGWERSDGWLSSESECTWYGIGCNENSEIVTLDLYNNSISGNAPMELGLLGPSLLFLDLGANLVTNKGEEMKWMEDLNNLVELRLFYLNFDSAGIPTYIGVMTDLQYLDVSYTLMAGSFNADQVFSNLDQLREVKLGGLAFNDAIPTQLVALPNLQKINLDQAQLTGDFDFLTQMTSLVHLSLDGNFQLQGSLPTELGTFASLESFAASACGLSGTIPSEIGLLSATLQHFSVHNNRLTGQIPTELQQLSNIQTLELQGNSGLIGRLHIQPSEVESRTQDANENANCGRFLQSMSADCPNNVDCPCCTCCGSPCDTEVDGSMVEVIVKLEVALPDSDFTTDSPHRRALDWMRYHDSVSLSKPTASLARLYALATLYYSTNAVSNVFTESLSGSGVAPSSWNKTDGWLDSVDECTWFGVQCNDDGIVDGLQLGYNGMSGSIPREMSLMKDLIYLDLSGNQVANAGDSLAWMGELIKLQYLDVHFCNFDYVGIPTYLANLVELEVLDVSYTLFFGELDGAIFAPLTKLKYLEMGGNSYHSSIPSEIISLPNLEFLYCDFTHLTGDLSFLGSFEGPLKAIWLDYNPDLVGSIPASIASLTTLESISLTSCELTLTIPSELGSLTNMETLWLYDNAIHGTIPTEVALMTSLTRFQVEGNEITGQMPPSMCDARENSLSMLSADCMMPSSEVSCQCCTCCVAPCVDPLSPAKSIAAALAQVGIEVDDGGHALQAFQWLEVDPAVHSYHAEKIVQRFALASFWYATSAQRNTHISTEPVPGWNITNGWISFEDECGWFGLTCDDNGRVTVIDLSNNGLSGSMPAEISLLGTTLFSLDIGGNDIASSEQQLSWITSLVHLKHLDVNSCNIESNGIPSGISALTNIESLDISYTLIYGPINGSVFEPLTQLHTLEMGGNDYKSSLPTEIASLPHLENLYLDYTSLSGDLSFLTSMPMLFEMWADFNPNLSGSIPSGIGSASLLGSLSVTSCGLSGTLPTSMGLLTNMQQMWLYDNKLSGAIPSEIAMLTSMRLFRTEGNSMSGSMPQGVCDLRQDVLGSLGTDCLLPDPNVGCLCCTCCQHPCGGEVEVTTETLESKGIAASGSYRNLVSAWMKTDPGVPSYSEDKITQRFALASIYFATDSIQNNDTSIGFGQGSGLRGWTSTDGWLSDSDECSWYGIECDDNGVVYSVNLTNNDLYGTFPNEISLLRGVKVLDLSNNQLMNSDSELAWLAELTGLSYLALSGCNFTAQHFPSYFGKLSSLAYLDISSTNFGELDGTLFSNLTSLTYLDISNNANGYLPHEITSLQSLKYLYAINGGIDGDLSFIGEMPSIERLWLDQNIGLAGGVPASIGNATSLTSLSISDCGLMGSIPSTFGRLVNLKEGWFFNNRLTGMLPDELGALTALSTLHTENNYFQGMMPLSICALRNIHGGQLSTITADCDKEAGVACACCTCCQSSCQGDGVLVTASSMLEDASVNLLGYVQTKAVSWLQRNEQFVSYVGWRNIQRFSLASIYYATRGESDTLDQRGLLEGERPTFGWNNSSGWLTDSNECSWYGIQCDDGGRIVAIELPSNRLTGSFPDQVVHLGQTLAMLDLSGNDLNNTGDEGLAWMIGLQKLELMNLQGTNFRYLGVPSYFPSSLVVLDISNTQFTGALNGSAFVNLRKLKYLDMSQNTFAAALPREIAKLPQLMRLFADSAHLTGDLSFIGEMSRIQQLSVNDNPRLGGTIPQVIGNVRSLAGLSAVGCNITGSLPSQLGKLTNLRDLILSNNFLTGTIPVDLKSLTSLHSLIFERNNLQGELPDAICALRKRTLSFLSSDCKITTGNVDCRCCSCCEAPCSDHSLIDVGQVLKDRGIECTHSYQEAAVEWLQADQALQSYDDWIVLQRYALAAIHFATSGAPNNFTTSVFGQDVPGWQNDRDWLSHHVECYWHGITCDNNGVITAIELPSNRLSGSMPEEIQVFRMSLEKLDLSNNFVANKGDEMSWLATLGRLRHLDIHNCNFEYQGLPVYLGLLSNLEYADLSNNRFVGPLEGATFAHLKKLKHLNIGSNGFSSDIPTEMTALPNLEHVYAENNHFTGNVSFMEYMSVSVRDFWIGGNPELGGSIPTVVGDLSNLLSISMQGCGFTGTIPTELCYLKDTLREIWMGHNHLTGSIPTELGIMTSLELLRVDGNQLLGQVPNVVCGLRDYLGGKLTSLSTDCLDPLAQVNCNCCSSCGSSPTSTQDYQVNVTKTLDRFELLTTAKYQKEAQEWLEMTEIHILQTYSDMKLIQRYALACIFYGTWAVDTKFTREAFVGNASGWFEFDLWLNHTVNECDWYGVRCDNDGWVNVLDLSYNGLSGNLPVEIGLLKEIVHLDVSGNLVAGKDEELSWLTMLTKLSHLDLHYNNFEYNGIPGHLEDLVELEYLDLSYTLFYGPLSGPTFRYLEKLTHLALGGNVYNSSIPRQIPNLPLLEYLDFENSYLTGSLGALANLSPHMIELHLNGNAAFKGSIPLTFGLLTNLKRLSLSDSKLTGPIPSELGRLTWIEELWLNNNTFTGSIPSELEQLTRLEIFRNENNSLAGSVPAGFCRMRDAIGGPLSQLTADCSGLTPEVTCACCTCCESPC